MVGVLDEVLAFRRRSTRRRKLAAINERGRQEASPRRRYGPRVERLLPSNGM